MDEMYKRDKLARGVEAKLKHDAKERKKLLAELKNARKQEKPTFQKIKALKSQLSELEKDGEWDETFANATVLVEQATDAGDGKTLRKVILQCM